MNGVAELQAVGVENDPLGVDRGSEDGHVVRDVGGQGVHTGGRGGLNQNLG